MREWLGALVTGRVVTYGPAAALGKIAAFGQYIGLLGPVEEKIVTCFEQGGGVPYADFPRVQNNHGRNQRS